MRDGAREPAAQSAAQGGDRRARQLMLGFAGLVSLSFALIVLGALVRAHGAGLACPDWPLCFGNLIPEMNLEVAFEWSHRVLAGSVSILFLGTAALALLHPPSRRLLEGRLAVAASLLLLQVLLGALTVWQLLASWTVTSHLVTGNAFAAVLLLCAVRLWKAVSGSAQQAVPRGARPLVAALAGCLLAQIVLGGLVSSTFAGLACTEWPTCSGGVFYPSLQGSVGLHLLHRSNGYLLLVIAGVSVLSVRRPTRLAHTLAGFFLVAFAQMTVGIVNVLLALPVEITALHSALATTLVLLVAFAVNEVWSAPVALPTAAAQEFGSG